MCFVSLICQRRSLYLMHESTVVSEPAVAHRAGTSSALNRTSHISRLGLARALSRSADTQDQAKKLYEEVISMAPGVSCLSCLELRYFLNVFTIQLTQDIITDFIPTQLLLLFKW